MEESRKPFIVFLKPGCKKMTVPANTDLATPEIVLLAGPNEITDPEVIKLLLKYPGTALVDAQQAVDLGYVSAECAAELGHQIVVGTSEEGKPVIQPAPPEKYKPVKESSPDFAIMTKQELMGWAEENDLVLKRTLHHSDMVKVCKRRWKELKE